MGTIAPNRDELTADVKATLAARRELGPEMDDELVDLLMARVDSYVQSRLDSERRPQFRAAPVPPPVHRGMGIPHPLLVLLVGVFVLVPILGLVHVHAFPLVVVLVLIAYALRRTGRGPRYR